MTDATVFVQPRRGCALDAVTVALAGPGINEEYLKVNERRKTTKDDEEKNKLNR